MSGPMWMPGAKRLPATMAGTMDGSHGTRKVVWHNEGVDRPGDAHNAPAVARYVRDRGIAYHLIWDSTHGVFVQLYPADVAARSLLNPGGLPWSPNRQGALCVQVCVVGYGHRPFTDGPLAGLPRVMAWLDDLGVPRKARDFANPGRGQDAWTRSGHHGHAHAPGNDHTDPGPISPRRLFDARKTSYRQGDRGPVVRDIQKALGIRADGIFGKETAATLKAWQRARWPARNGVAGPHTLRALGVKVDR